MPEAAGVRTPAASNCRPRVGSTSSVFVRRAWPATARAWLAVILGLALVPVFAASDIERRVRVCTVCHGDEGRAGSDGFYPRLAGKPAAYLHEQLLHFRDARRHYALMSRLIEPLSDAHLFEFAQYFSARRAPYPAPSVGAGGMDAQALRRGEQLALRGDPDRGLPACAGCHAPRLTGVLPDVPGLLGLPRDYISAQLGAWQAGTRRARVPDCMADIARALTPTDVSALSAWLSAQRVPRDDAPARSLPAWASGQAPQPSCGAKALQATRPQSTR